MSVKLSPELLETFLHAAEVVAPIALGAAHVPPFLVPIIVDGIKLAETFATDQSTSLTKKLAATAVVEAGLVAAGQAPSATIDPTISNGIDKAITAINAHMALTSVTTSATPSSQQ